MNQARANAKGVPKTVSGICLTIHIVNRGLSDAAGSEVYGRCYETDTKCTVSAEMTMSDESANTASVAACIAERGS